MKRKRQGINVTHSDHVDIANHQEGSTSSMDGSSISNPYIILDADDDPYFSPFVSQDSISDEKYAEQLQLHEALVFSSASRASTSSSIKTPMVMLDDQGSHPSTSSSPKTPVVVLDDQASLPSTSSSPKTPIVILESKASRASNSSSPKTPFVILDDQDSHASTSSSPSTPIMTLESKASRASTSSSPKTAIVILDDQDSHAFESSKIADQLCDICMDAKPESEMFRNTKVCGHMFCFDCIRGHVAAKIRENIIKVGCPKPNCRGIIGPEACHLFVPREVLERWEDVLCESLILWPEKFYCPIKDCSALLVNDDGGPEGAVTSSECPHCNRLFCARCKETWHSGISCREYQSKRKDERDPSDLMLRDLAKNKNWKRCPSCKSYVEKISGRDNIECRCGRDFDYNSHIHNID